MCRPLIVVGGSCDQYQENMGGFQEYPQVLKFLHSLSNTPYTYAYALTHRYTSCPIVREYRGKTKHYAYTNLKRLLIN